MRTSITFVFSVLAAVSTVSANCVRNYTVQAGDICDGISASQKVSTYQLASANTEVINNECSNLAAGMDLCLGWAGHDCTNIIIVADADSCASITAAAGITTSQLTINNPQINSDCSNLYSGEVLCVENKTNVDPYPSGSPISVNWEATVTPAASSSFAIGAANATAASATSSSTASAAVATFYDAADAFAVGIDYDTLPFCDEAW